MNPAPIPQNEAARLAALREFQILDTEAEEEFDDIVELASQLCEVPISLVTFVDEKRQWFKAKRGLEISETHREVAFCSHAIHQKDLMVVPDAFNDERFRDNPLVTNEPNIRFYAGMPLVTDDGLALGTLCVIDRKPRTLTPQQILALRVLAKNVVALLKLRETKKELSSIITALPVIFFRINKDNRFADCHTSNPDDLFISSNHFIGKRIDEMLPPELAQLTIMKIEAARKSGNVETFEYSLLVPSGLSWFEARVLVTSSDEVMAIISNITKAKRAEEEKNKSLRFIQAITNNVPALISYWTSDLRLSFANDSYLKWYGTSREDAMGISLIELTGEEIYQRIKPNIDKVLKGEPQDFEFPRMWNNELVHLRVQYIPEVQHEKVEGFFVQITDITRLIKAEEEKTKTLHFIQTITDNVPAMISHWTADLRNTFANEAYLKWFDRKKEDMLGVSLMELTGENNFQQIKEYTAKALKGEPQDVQFSRTQKNELTHWRAQYLPDINQGKVAGMYALVTDITEIKKAEENARMQKDLADSLLNNLPGICYLFEEKKKIIRWNKNLEVVTGYDAEEINKMHPADFIVVDDQAKFNERIEMVFAEKLSGVSVTLLTKENKKIPYYLNTHRIIVEGASCILGIGVDISDHVFTSHILRNTLKELTHYRKALNESSIIAITDNKGIITYVNNNFLKISKYSKNELIGNTHRIINSGFHSKQFFKELWKTISNGKIWNGQIKNKAKDGTLYWVDTTIVPFKSEAGKPSQYLAVRRDITARKLSEEALHKSEANLKTVFENTDTSYILLNANLEIISFNQTARILFERHIGKKLVVGYHANHYLLDKKKYLVEALAGKNVVNIEDYSRNPINDFWLFERYLPIYDEQKTVTGLIISFSDISVVKKAELVMKENEQRLATILNNMVGGIVKTDTHGIITYINEGAKHILGIDHYSSIESKSIYDICQPFDDEGMSMPVEAFPVTIALDQNLRIANSKIGISVKKNIKKWVSINSSPVYNKNGQLEGVLCSFVDITESVETQNKLMTVSSRLLLAKQLTGMGIWEWDMKANKLIWDDQMFDLTGVGKGTEPTLSLFYSRIHQDDVEKVKRKMEEFTKNGGGDDVFRFVHNDKSIRYLRIIVVTHKKKDKPVSILGVTSDITNIILQEQDIMKANQKISDLQQVALRAAMNPHFLYNALNSIQFFITHNDRSNALSYLSKFSKLMRGILNGSINKISKLSDELELLRHYIEIEQMRFTNKFDYTFELDDELEADNYEIPSLIMQPYVENAILHGLYNKEGIGLLTISIRYEDKTLAISIEDNGIGRKAAAELRKKNFPNYQSKGIQITEERMKLMDTGNTTISSSILDLYDGKNPIGTRVIIKIKEN